jgi:hypothetical protein
MGELAITIPQRIQEFPDAAIQAARSLKKSVKNQVNELVLDRPMLALISVVAFAALGIALSASALIALPFIPLKAVLIATAAGSSFSIAALTILSLAKQYRYLVSLFSHLSYKPLAGNSMEKRFFVEGSCRGGELKYINGIPVLKMTSQKPEEMGFAQGYLAGKNIHAMWKRYLRPGCNLLFHSLSGYEKLLKEANKVVIPEAYRKEMEGMVEGYNKWREEEDAREGLFIASRKLTLTDVIAWHSFIDIYKGDMEAMSPLGCSAVAVRNGNGVLLGRNLEWPSLRVVADNTLMVVRKPEKGLQSAIACFAGNVGSITGVNEEGVCTILNEAGKTFKPGRVPYNLLHRLVLEQASSVREAKEVVRNNPPASSHLMTIGSPTEATLLQFYADGRDGYIERGMENGILAVTNHCTGVNGEYLPETEVSKTSQWRKRTLERDMPLINPERSIEAGLVTVQNDMTIHKIMIDPVEGRFQIAWNNTYAADLPMRSLSFDELFSREEAEPGAGPV